MSKVLVLRYITPEANEVLRRLESEGVTLSDIILSVDDALTDEILSVNTVNIFRAKYEATRAKLHKLEQKLKKMQKKS